MKSRFIILAAMLLFLLSACQLSLAEDITPPPNYKSPTPGPTMSPLFPQGSPDVVSGEAIYVEKCAPCHGDNGLGEGPMAAQLQKAPSALGSQKLGRNAALVNWFTTVTQGNINSMMPPFNASLNDQQRWDVVAYALSLGGSTATEAEKGKLVYEENCSQCHGAAGDLVEKAAFTDQALMAKLTQSDIVNFVDKGVGSMPGFGGLISEEDMYAVAAYTRFFSLSVVGASPSATPAAPEPNATPETAETPESTPEAVLEPTELVGSISGKVINGSGGAVSAGLVVTLHVFEHDISTQQFSEISLQEVPVGDDGSYKFNNISLLATRAFFVSTNYSNTEYASDPVFPTEGQTNLELSVTVFDTTTDTSGLVAEQVHILLDYSKPDVVQVVQFIIVSNPGTKSVVAADKGGPVVKVTLPKGYTNLQFEQGAIGDRYLKTDDGFADTALVPPGEQKYQLVYAVDLPLPQPGLFGGRKLDFSQSFPFKISNLSVLSPEGVTIEGPNLSAGDSQDMGTGTKFQVFEGGSLEVGKILQFTASGTPQGITQPATTGLTTNQGIIFGVGAFGMVLIIVGVWMYWRDRQRSEADDADLDDEVDDADEMSMDEIMDAIVALDDQFKAGNLQEAAYKERREELKAKLKSMR